MNNTVRLWDTSYINQTTQTKDQDNADAVVLTVSPNRAASLVGSGPLGAPLQPTFGNTDFRLYNIDVANRAVGSIDRFIAPALTIVSDCKWRGRYRVHRSICGIICGVRQRLILQLPLCKLPRYPICGSKWECSLLSRRGQGLHRLCMCGIKSPKR